MSRQTEKRLRKARDELLGVDELPLRSAQPSEAPKELRAVDVGEIQVMRDEAKRLAQDSSARTKNMKTAVAESEQVGHEIVEELEKQTGQLENIDQHVDDLQVVIDRGERTVNKLTKRWFSRSSRKTKNQSAEQQQQAADRKAAGVASLPPRRSGGGASSEGGGGGAAASSEDAQRAELLGEVAARAGRPRKDGAAGNANGAAQDGSTAAATAPRDHHEQLMDELDEAERQQDGDLSDISKNLLALQGLAGAMNEELKYQGDMMDKIAPGVTHADDRLKDNSRKLKRFVK